AIYGEDIIVEKLRFVKLVLIDADASDKYKERLKKRCDGVETFEIENLGDALHRENVKAVAISNEGLASEIINLLR
ncbi:MAG: hypothetical protein RR405_01205, partial [Clostridia bacterium]